MNAGKTTNLLQSRHNYAERGMNTLVIKPRIDSRSGENRVRSRIGLEAEAVDVDPSVNLLGLVQTFSTGVEFFVQTLNLRTAFGFV